MYKKDLYGAIRCFFNAVSNETDLIFFAMLREISLHINELKRLFCDPGVLMLY